MVAELKEIDVERIDGVDEPATRKRFLILKAEEPDELRAAAEDLVNKVAAALKLLADADIVLDEAAAKALDEVAEAVGLEPTFVATKVKPYGYGYGYAPTPKSEEAKSEEEVEKSETTEESNDLLARIAQIEEKINQLVESLKPASGTTVAKSRQPAAQDTDAVPRKLGEGLFADVILRR